MALTFVLYNSIVLFSTLFIYLSEKTTTVLQRKTCLVIAFLIIFIPAAIRYFVGVDLPNYEVAFYQIKTGVEVRFEIGYYFLNYLIAILNLSFEWLVAFISLITYMFFFRAYPNKNAWLIHFLFMCTLYLYTYSNLRSGIIYALMFVSVLHYIDNKKLIPFLLSTLIAVSFHKSAVVYLILPVLFSRYFLAFINKKLVTEFILIALILLLFQPNLLHTILFNNPLSILLGFNHYGSNPRWGQSPELGSGLGVVIKLIPIILFILFRKYFIKRDLRARYIVVLCLILFAAVDLGLAVKVAHRFEKYFFFTYFLVIYFIYNNLKNYFKLFFILFYILFYFVTFNK